MAVSLEVILLDSKSITLTVEARRRLLKTFYNTRGWSIKVDKMHDNQVIAVYARMTEQLNEEATTRQKLLDRTNYECYECGKQYKRDNDALGYCAFCGSKRIAKTKTVGGK